MTFFTFVWCWLAAGAVSLIILYWRSRQDLLMGDLAFMLLAGPIGMVTVLIMEFGHHLKPLKGWHRRRLVRGLDQRKHDKIKPIL